MLIAGLVAMMYGCLAIGLGNSFMLMALGRILLGVGIAFKSGTDNALLDNSLIGSSQQDGVAKHEVRALAV